MTKQNDQLGIGHHMLTILRDNRLYVAPIDEGNCRRVLDVGCGTGIWQASLDIQPYQTFANHIRPYSGL
jgi:predicted TPR repeat methyltransferase